MGSSSQEYVDAASAPRDGILDGIAAAFTSVRRVGADFFRLLSLEVRRAGLTLVWMLTLGAMAAMLIVTAWLGLMGALALWAVSLGVTWISAMVAIALANLAVAAIAVVSCIVVSRNLLFPATQRQLDAPAIPSDAP